MDKTILELLARRAGLPLSVQFVGRYFAEATTLFQVAREWERAAGMENKHPPLT